MNIEETNSSCSFYNYLKFKNAELFTIVWLPQSSGTFSTVIYRSPYVDVAKQQTENEICTHTNNCKSCR